MISKIHITTNPEKVDTILQWCEHEEDFIVKSMPTNLTRSELIDLVDEIKKVTNCND